MILGIRVVVGLMPVGSGYLASTQTIKHEAVYFGWEARDAVFIEFEELPMLLEKGI